MSSRFAWKDGDLIIGSQEVHKALVDDAHRILLRFSERVLKYNPDQPRDSHGRFGSGGGGMEDRPRKRDFTGSEALHDAVSRKTIEAATKPGSGNKIYRVKLQDGRTLLIACPSIDHAKAMSRSYAEQHLGGAKVATVGWVNLKKEPLDFTGSINEHLAERPAGSTSTETPRPESAGTKPGSALQATYDEAQKRYDAAQAKVDELTRQRDEMKARQDSPDFSHADRAELGRVAMALSEARDVATKEQLGLVRTLGEAVNVEVDRRAAEAMRAAGLPENLPEPKGALEVKTEISDLYRDVAIDQKVLGAQLADAAAAAYERGMNEAISKDMERLGLSNVNTNELRQLIAFDRGVTIFADGSVAHNSRLDGSITYTDKNGDSHTITARLALDEARNFSGSHGQSTFRTPYYVEMIDNLTGRSFSSGMPGKPSDFARSTLPGSLASVPFTPEERAKWEGEVNQLKERINQADAKLKVSTSEQEQAVSQRKQAADIYREQHLAVLNELRPMGQGKADIEGLFDSTRFVSGKNKVSADFLKNGMEVAGSLYPKDWLEAAKREPVTLKFSMAKNDALGTYYEDSRSIFVRRLGQRPEEDIHSTFAHEVGHHMQSMMNEITPLEYEFLRSRDSGPNRVLGPGYSRDTIGLPDKFPDPYTGRIYPWGQARTEVLTTGIQALNGTPHGPSNDRYRSTDRDFSNFINGLLLLANRPEKSKVK